MTRMRTPVAHETRICTLEPCGREFTYGGERTRQRFCSTACSREYEQQARYARGRAATAARLADRRCVDCSAGMQGRSIMTPRCAACSRERSNAQKREYMLVKRASAREGRGDALATKSTQQRPAPGEAMRKARQAARERVAVAKRVMSDEAESQRVRRGGPNLKGDWFPGWNGCYPPTLSELEIQWLEEGRGRRGIKIAPSSVDRETSGWTKERDLRSA